MSYPTNALVAIPIRNVHRLPITVGRNQTVRDLVKINGKICVDRTRVERPYQITPRYLVEVR